MSANLRSSSHYISFIASSVLVLGIENCEQVTDTVLSIAVSRFHALRFLSADSIPSLGPELLQSVATHQAGLQDLFLNKCPAVGDPQVELLAKHCRKVESNFSMHRFVFIQFVCSCAALALRNAA